MNPITTNQANAPAQIIQQLVSALEYHQEQTRPIQRTIDAIAAGHAALAAAPTTQAASTSSASVEISDEQMRQGLAAAFAHPRAAAPDAVFKAGVNFGVSVALLQTAPATQAAPQAEDEDGKAFRDAARLGLTLRFYGGCAQSGMPGSPSAYEVVSSQDRAAAMREAIERAKAVIASGGEAQRLAAPQPAAPQGDVAAAHLQALLRYTANFYAIAIERGMPAGQTANMVAHVERAARALHALAAQPQEAAPGAQGDAEDAARLDFICGMDKDRMLQKSKGLWRVYQDEAPIESDTHDWCSMTYEFHSSPRAAIDAARSQQEGKSHG